MANAKALLHILDHCHNFAEISRLIDGKTAFQRLFTIEHIRSTVRSLEKEIRRQEAKAAILLDQLIKEKLSKRLRRYLRRTDDPFINYSSTRKHTPPISPPSSLSSTPMHHHSPEPLPIPPPKGTRDDPIIITDENPYTTPNP